MVNCVIFSRSAKSYNKILILTKKICVLSGAVAFLYGNTALASNAKLCQGAHTLRSIEQCAKQHCHASRACTANLVHKINAHHYMVMNKRAEAMASDPSVSESQLAGFRARMAAQQQQATKDLKQLSKHEKALKYRKGLNAQQLAESLDKKEIALKDYNAKVAALEELEAQQRDEGQELARTEYRIEQLTQRIQQERSDSDKAKTVLTKADANIAKQKRIIADNERQDMQNKNDLQRFTANIKKSKEVIKAKQASINELSAQLEDSQALSKFLSSEIQSTNANVGALENEQANVGKNIEDMAVKSVLAQSKVAKVNKVLSAAKDKHSDIVQQLSNNQQEISDLSDPAYIAASKKTLEKSNTNLSKIIEKTMAKSERGDLIKKGILLDQQAMQKDIQSQINNFDSNHEKKLNQMQDLSETLQSQLSDAVAAQKDAKFAVNTASAEEVSVNSDLAEARETYRNNNVKINKLRADLSAQQDKLVVETNKQHAVELKRQDVSKDIASAQDRQNIETRQLTQVNGDIVKIDSLIAKAKDAIDDASARKDAASSAYEKVGKEIDRYTVLVKRSESVAKIAWSKNNLMQKQSSEAKAAVGKSHAALRDVERSVRKATDQASKIDGDLARQAVEHATADESHKEAIVQWNIYNQALKHRKEADRAAAQARMREQGVKSRQLINQKDTRLKDLLDD